MIKKEFLKICLFLLTFIFCSSFGVVAYAGTCDECNKSGGVQTISANTNFPPGWKIAWDYDNSAQTIGLSDSVSIVIIGNGTSFTWEVGEGKNGYTLGDTTTEEQANTLISAADADCGSIPIKVTDSNGNSVTGYVRQTEGGHWVVQPQLANTCPIPGPVTEDGPTSLDAYRVEGNTRIHEVAVVVNQRQRCNYNCCPGWASGEGACESHCNDEGCSSRGCTPCITGKWLGSDAGQCPSCGRYPFALYIWQSPFWCGNGNCCWCVCNASITVEYWECD